MRILVVGVGVIGSVYAGKLLAAGHEVVLLARGRRLADLQASGLILEEAQSGKRTVLPVTAVAALDSADRYDLVLVPVRSEQLTSTLPILSSMRDGSDVLFFGNTAGRQAQLVEALGGRVLLGFPAAGGTCDGSVVRYVLIGQQQTMLGEPDGATTSRTRHLKTMLQDAGFPTTITANMDGWLLGHAAFVVPIACALYRVDTNASRLAAIPAPDLNRLPTGVLRACPVAAVRRCWAARGPGRGGDDVPGLRRRRPATGRDGLHRHRGTSCPGRWCADGCGVELERRAGR